MAGPELDYALRLPAVNTHCDNRLFHKLELYDQTYPLAYYHYYPRDHWHRGTEESAPGKPDDSYGTGCMIVPH